MPEDPIFKFREVLTPSYIPDNLPHREEELKAISSLVNDALHNQITNIFIYGPSGTGKTASIKFVFHKLKETNALPVCLNCFRINTRMGALYSVFEKFFRKIRPTRRMPSRRGIAYDELFDSLHSEIKRDKTKLVVCFDEIDHLIPKGSEVLYDLSRLKEESLSCQIIAISNDELIFRNIDPRILSSMHPLEFIAYRPYGFEQMKDIIRVKVEVAFQPGVFEDKAIDLLARYTAAEGGDVRIARETLLQAGELARKKGHDRITVEHIEAVLGETKFVKIQSMVSQLSGQERSILRLIPEKGVSYPDFSYLYEQYYPDAIKDRMLRNYLDKFERLKLVSLERKGIGGAYWITLNVPRKVLEEAI